MRNEDDWFRNFKMQILSLVSLLNMLKEDMILMMTMSDWVLEEVSLEKSFFKLQQVLSQSDQELDFFIRKIESLEQGDFFHVTELQDTFSYLHDSIYLELDYMNLISDYLLNFNQPIFHRKRGTETFFNQEKRVLEQIQKNHQDLKQLRKERREDYFE